MKKSDLAYGTTPKVAMLNESDDNIRIVSRFGWTAMRDSFVDLSRFVFRPTAVCWESEGGFIETGETQDRRTLGESLTVPSPAWGALPSSLYAVPVGVSGLGLYCLIACAT